MGTLIQSSQCRHQIECTGSVWLRLNGPELHSRFSQNLSQAKNQKNSSNKNRAIFQYLCMSKAYAEILRICFPSCFWDIGPQRAKIGPNGQTHDNRPRRSNKNIFPLDFKHWVLIFHKNFEFLFLRMNLGSFGVKIGSNLAPKDQKCTQRTR